MILAVVIGTLFDMLHKHSARFFLRQRKKSKAAAKRPLGVVDTASLAARTIAVEIVTSGEFQNAKRRIYHLLMFYGFLTYLVTTVAMIFGYPAGTPTPVFLPLLWNIGALMVLE